MKALKYKHIFGEPLREKFEQVVPSTITCDSTMIKVKILNLSIRVILSILVLCGVQAVAVSSACSRTTSLRRCLWISP